MTCGASFQGRFLPPSPPRLRPSSSFMQTDAFGDVAQGATQLRVDTRRGNSALYERRQRSCCACLLLVFFHISCFFLPLVLDSIYVPRLYPFILYYNINISSLVPKQGDERGAHMLLSLARKPNLKSRGYHRCPSFSAVVLNLISLAAPCLSGL